MGVPYNVININFRNLQNQYVTGENRRNTQFRPNLWWYMVNIGMMNPYKAEIFGLTRNRKPFSIENYAIYYYKDDSSSRRLNSFENRLSFYITNVFGKDLTDTEIIKLRHDLGFDSGEKSFSRNISLAELVRNIDPDECVACKDEHDISERSFISERTNRYYFEIHHVISIGTNQELDDENNMVKLCPTCHRQLKRGAASKEEQCKLIDKIFKNKPNTLEFAKHFFDTNDYETIVNKTWESLN